MGRLRGSIVLEECPSTLCPIGIRGEGEINPLNLMIHDRYDTRYDPLSAGFLLNREDCEFLLIDL